MFQTVLGVVIFSLIIGIVLGGLCAFGVTFSKIQEENEVGKTYNPNDPEIYQSGETLWITK
jgi:MFS superfamily sulfate permease-like transporter